jgi:hypothetical protein
MEWVGNATPRLLYPQGKRPAPHCIGGREGPKLHVFQFDSAEKIYSFGQKHKFISLQLLFFTGRLLLDAYYITSLSKIQGYSK